MSINNFIVRQLQQSTKDFSLNTFFNTDNSGTTISSGYLFLDSSGNLKDIFRIITSNGGTLNTNKYINTNFYIGSVTPNNDISYYLSQKSIFTTTGLTLATVNSTTQFPSISNSLNIIYIIGGSAGSITFNLPVTILQIFLVGGGGGSNSSSGAYGGDVTNNTTVQYISSGSIWSGITIGNGGNNANGGTTSITSLTLSAVGGTATGGTNNNGTQNQYNLL